MAIIANRVNRVVALLFSSLYQKSQVVNQLGGCHPDFIKLSLNFLDLSVS